MSSKIIGFLILLCSLFQINFITAPPQNQTINAVIGDVSFADAFGRFPNNSDSEIQRITTHLEYVTSLLESADVSHLTNTQRKNRRRLISLLKIYTKENPFPKNYDFRNERRPTFIDEHGNICAVGYLVQQTEGQEVAEAINEEYKYGYVLEMDSKLLNNWLVEYGLTKKEAAMIQPTYGPPPGEEETIEVRSVKSSYAVSSGLLTGLQLTLSGFSFSESNSYRTNSMMTYTSIGLGAISLVNGIYQLDQSTTRYNSVWGGLGGTIKEVNVSKRNLSIANIAFGSASIAFNTYRAFQLKKERNLDRFAFTPSVEYVPGLTEPIPTASLSLRF